MSVTIDNCDQEPIHIPGAIQPHGILLALADSDLRLRQASDNAPALLGIELARLFTLPLEGLVGEAAAAVLRGNRGARTWKRFNPIATEIAGQKLDAVVHRSGELVVVELEPAGLATHGGYRDYGADTHQALMQLQAAESMPELLEEAVQVVRRVTGYDRVMVYRFDQDGHGQVVAEDRLASLEPFLGLHYPASDIPAQARRLYVANPLRIIADIGYRPSGLVAAPGTVPSGPLDMTHSTLRSVSPIHVEYLRNMGVGASMSVSLVHGDKLWGLIACHHYGPKLVPYPVRMTCELVGRTLATLILSMQRSEEVQRQELLSGRRTRLLERLARADYVAIGLTEMADDFLGLVDASGAAILEDGRCTRAGRCPSEEGVRAFAAWMAASQRDMVASHGLAAEFPDAPKLGPDAAGVLAFVLPQMEDNAIMWFRPAAEHTVTWAGNPEKVYDEGPNGPRLSPRGSFALWKQTVRDQSERWTRLQIEGASELRARLMEVLVRRAREAERSRDMLLGMVSHDLRNPLGAISLAAHVLNAGEAEQGVVTRTSARIAASSDRMRRMIEQLLDYTRTKSGTLSVEPAQMDLVTLCRQLVEETEAAHPGFRLTATMPESCPFVGDPDRIAQIVSNLLGNARHHGDTSQPVHLTLRRSDAGVELEVQNHGKPIPADRLETIFEPFKRDSKDARSSRHSGLGLGLFIVKRLVDLHHGKVRITSTAEAGTICTVTLPIVDWSAVPREP